MADNEQETRMQQNQEEEYAIPTLRVTGADTSDQENQPEEGEDVENTEEVAEGVSQEAEEEQGGEEQDGFDGNPNSWNKERQKKDEEIAAFRKENDVLKDQIGEVQQELKNLRQQSQAQPQDQQKSEQSEDDSDTEIELLPEKDEYGDPDPKATAYNKLAKQTNQLRRCDREYQEKIEELEKSNMTRAEREKQEENHRAFQKVLSDSCEGDDDLRNSLVDAVEKEFQNRGYNENKVPEPDMTELIVQAQANRLKLEKATQPNTKQPKQKKKPAQKKGVTVPESQNRQQPAQPEASSRLSLRDAVKRMKSKVT